MAKIFTIKFDHTTSINLNALHHSLGASKVERDANIILMKNRLKARFEECQGVPTDCYREPRLPGTYGWQYDPELYLHFKIYALPKTKGFKSRLTRFLRYVIRRQQFLVKIIDVSGGFPIPEETPPLAPRE